MTTVAHDHLGPGEALSWVAGLLLAVSAFTGWYAIRRRDRPRSRSSAGTRDARQARLLHGPGGARPAPPARHGARAPGQSSRRRRGRLDPGTLGTIFVLVRLIDMPDRFLGAGRGIGIWISLVSALAVVGAGLLAGLARGRPPTPQRPGPGAGGLSRRSRSPSTVSTGASVEGSSVRTPVCCAARPRRVLDRPPDHEADEKDGDEHDEPHRPAPDSPVTAGAAPFGSLARRRPGTRLRRQRRQLIQLGDSRSRRSDLAASSMGACRMLTAGSPTPHARRRGTPRRGRAAHRRAPHVGSAGSASSRRPRAPSLRPPRVQRHELGEREALPAATPQLADDHVDERPELPVPHRTRRSASRRFAPSPTADVRGRSRPG